MNLRYKLIAVDFDGTLLNDSIKVSEKNKNELLKHKRNGYIIVAVTGRTLDAVVNLIDINVFDYLILNNGSYIYDVSNKMGKYIGVIDNDMILKITKLVYTISSKINYCSATKYYRYKDKNYNSSSYIINIDNFNNIRDKIAKIDISLINNNDIYNIVKKINKEYDVDSFVMQDSNSDDRHICVMPKGINKKYSLEILCNKLYISKEEIIFFGDGLNDLEIIEWVGCGVAMENAFDIVKEKASFITKSNNDDGVAFFLENYNN